MPGKVKVKLIGEDGNVFNLIGKVKKALKLAGEEKKANEFTKKAFSAKTYREVLILCVEYCDVM